MPPKASGTGTGRSKAATTSSKSSASNTGRSTTSASKPRGTGTTSTNSGSRKRTIDDYTRGGFKRTQPEDEEEEEQEEAEVEEQDVEEEVDQAEEEEEEEEDDRREKIPPELLTRILHTCFEREGTRITREADKAVARYVDVFVREAIARAAVERGRGFLEVCFAFPSLIPQSLDDGVLTACALVWLG
jgi:hypothetical protein